MCAVLFENINHNIKWKVLNTHAIYAARVL